MKNAAMTIALIFIIGTLTACGSRFNPAPPELTRAHVSGDFNVEATWYRIPIRVYAETSCDESEACYAEVCIEVIGQTVCERKLFRERERAEVLEVVELEDTEEDAVKEEE